MGMPRQSPYIRRRLVTAEPVHLTEPPVPDFMLPVLGALARNRGDEAIRNILTQVPVGLQPFLIGHMAGRTQYRHAMAAALRLIPRERLAAQLGAERLKRLLRAHG